MKKPTALLLWLFALPTLYAQSPLIDSLENVYKSASTSDHRFELLGLMNDAAYDVDLQIALQYSLRGIELAESEGDKSALAKFLEMHGRVYANLNVLDSALLYFDQALLTHRENGDKRGQATTLFKIAWVNRHKGENEKAMDADLTALRLMEEIDDQQGIASALGRISEDLSRQERNDEALDYALRSVEICEKNNLNDLLPFALRNTGDVFIAMGNNDAAFQYYDSALTLVKSGGFGLSDIADISNCRGNALKRLGRYEEAIKDYTTCLEVSTKLNYPGGISTGIANLGEINLLMGNYAAALPYQLKTVELMEQHGDVYNLTENYGHVSTIYEKLGDFRHALIFQKKARHMRDSIASVESDRAISELRTQYETDKKETTIAVQTAQLSQHRTMQWLYIGIAALLGLFALTFYRNSASRKRSNQLLAAKNAENELLLKEIHHRVKNNLEVVSSLLALQSAQINDPGVRDAMQEGQNRVQSIGIVHQKLYQGANLAAVEMKDYFINLSDSILDSFGADDRVTIECAMNTLELDIDTAVPLGLITNEILTNSLKYAFPDGRRGKIEINLMKKDDQTLQLKIADNGIGKSGLVHGTGFGSQLVSLLTRQLRGTMREDVAEGTAVYFDFALGRN